VIRVILPTHLRTLSRVNRAVELQVEGPATIAVVLDALEASYPVLRGTIRDQITGQRRPFIRFFACGQDYSLEGMDFVLPETVARGDEVLRVVGAMAGG